jgi:hypothetical protein
MPYKTEDAVAQFMSSPEMLFKKIPHTPSIMCKQSNHTLCASFLDLIVMEHKVDVPRSLCIVPYELLITLRSLLLCVAREHALQTHTHALDVVYGRPALAIEQVEADDAVRVDVRVPWDWVRVVFYEYDFGCLPQS